MSYKPDYDRIKMELHPIAYPLTKLFFFILKWALIAGICVAVFKLFS